MLKIRGVPTLMIKRLNRNPLALYAHYFIGILFLLSISRLALSLWLHERVDNENGWTEVIFQGIRIDVATLCFVMFIPALYTAAFSKGRVENLRSNTFTKIWLTSITCLFIFMELATPSFVQEYNIRPNRLFIEYLVYPKEVFGMLMKSKLPELVNSSVLTLLSGYVVWKWTSFMQENTVAIGTKWKPLTSIIILLLATLGARSSLGHRPLNPSMVYFSKDPLVNSLVLNSLYSVLWSSKQLLSEEKNSDTYGKLSEERIVDAAREFKGGNKQSYIVSGIPTYSNQPALFTGKPKNLVIILEESLGARFVGSLGGLPLTPNLDNLSKQGIAYSRMFATGTRSVRGIEAVVTGFTPTADRAVVKLDKSQSDFFSIAELLKRNHYHTEFIYGGEAHFDNMKSFFLGNGFENITEQKDYLSPKFVGSWGVSDEDMFDKANERFESLEKGEQPFFSLVFSSSNHEPFDFPQQRIEPFDTKINTRNNAIKYADWALGKFFKQAKKSNYWNNTVFLIIADHDARNSGSELIPIKSFHIPAVILGSGVPPRIDNRIASQIDMSPTLLSLIGIDNNSPMLGADISQASDDFESRAVLQNGQIFGYLTEDRIVILQPEKIAQSYSIDWKNWSYQNPIDTPQKTSEKVLGLALWGKLAYEKQLYRLP